MDAPAKLASFLARKDAAQSPRLQQTKIIDPAERLPTWPEAVRAVPNSILRSALFGAIKKGKRIFVEGEKIASYENVIIIQTGPRLDQADLDVWEHCLHLARTSKLGTCIQFSANSFLKKIGRDTGKSQHEWLKKSLRRLASSVVEIKDGERAYFGSMLHQGSRDDATKNYIIEINPQTAKLFGEDGWSQVVVDQRNALKKQPLAQWLHGFFSTHAAPYPIKVETILHLSGSQTKQLYHFRSELREALKKLEAVTGWEGSIENCDLLHITKTPTNSQARHLIKKRHEKHGIAPMKARHSADEGTA